MLKLHLHYTFLDLSFVPGNTLLLKSNTGRKLGIPTASQAVTRARYQPQITPSMPNPPPILNSIAMCSRSASVAACGTLKSAAAMNEKRKTSPTKTRTKRTLTRRVPTRSTKLTIALFLG